MTTAFTNPGMPEHFGIRITSAEKDKLVGELDADHRHVNRGGMCMAAPLPLSLTISAARWPG